MARAFPLKAKPVTMCQLKNMWVLATVLRVVQKYLMTCHYNKSRCLAITDRSLISDVTKPKEFSCLIHRQQYPSRQGCKISTRGCLNFNIQTKFASVTNYNVSAALLTDRTSQAECTVSKMVQQFNHRLTDNLSQPTPVA